MSDHSPESAAASGAARVRWLRLITAALVAILYAAACLHPAVRVGGCSLSLLGDWQENYLGLTAALLGWLSPFILPWIANPVLLTGWLVLLHGDSRRATALGGLAFALGSSAYLFLVKPYEIIPPDFGLSGLFTGYYLWQASMLVLVLGSVCAGGWPQLRKPGRTKREAA